MLSERRPWHPWEVALAEQAPQLLPPTVCLVWFSWSSHSGTTGAHCPYLT